MEAFHSLRKFQGGYPRRWKLDVAVKNYTAKIQAIACYYYETVSQVDICIDTEKYTRSPDQKVARVYDLKPLPLCTSDMP